MSCPAHRIAAHSLWHRVQHFGLILNYLRDGECDLPTDPRERKDLLREAEHYEVTLPLTRAPSSACSLEAPHLRPSQEQQTVLHGRKASICCIRLVKIKQCCSVLSGLLAPCMAYALCSIKHFHVRTDCGVAPPPEVAFHCRFKGWRTCWAVSRARSMVCRLSLLRASRMHPRPTCASSPGPAMTPVCWLCF